MASVFSSPFLGFLDPILALPLALALLCLVLCGLGALVRALNRRGPRPAPATETPGATETPSPAGTPGEVAPEVSPVAASAPTEQPAAAAPPPEQTAGWWWVKLLSGRAVLGLVFLPLQPVILIINSYLLALRLEVLIGRAGDPLFVLELVGWSREVNLFDIVGLLISLIQIVLAAAFVHSAGKTGRLKWTSVIALVALLSTLTLEVTLSIQSGMEDGGHSSIWVLNGLLALSIALTDVVCGIFLIEHLIIPLVLAVAWTIASPVRAVARRVKRRAARPKPARQPRPAAAPTPAAMGNHRRLVATLDSILSVITLRRLEAAVSRRLLRSATKFRFGKVRRSHV